MIDDQINKEIAALKQRNQRVELDKRWELSLTRRGFIVAVTYAAAAVWLIMIREPLAWQKALVPVAGYILSTLTLPWLKKFWIKLTLS